MSASVFESLWNEHMALGEKVKDLEQAMLKAAGLVAEALRDGGKLLVCGNGGSASQALHLQAELVVRMERDRRPLPAVALGASMPAVTAASNDFCFEATFEREVRALGTPKDVLVALSTSGRSENVRRAIVGAKDMGMRTVALLGRDGGFTVGLADVDIVVPGSSTARIQEWHLFLLHALLDLVERELRVFE